MLELLSPARVDFQHSYEAVRAAKQDSIKAENGVAIREEDDYR